MKVSTFSCFPKWNFAGDTVEKSYDCLSAVSSLELGPGVDIPLHSEYARIIIPGTRHV